MRTLIKSAVVVVAGAMSVTTSASSAELQLPEPASRSGHFASDCGPCGCLRVSYIYHRDMRTTYGTGFDPRNFDQTQPYFYPGRVRAYPRFWVVPCNDGVD
jgi:hypothetical protein